MKWACELFAQFSFKNIIKFCYFLSLILKTWIWCLKPRKSYSQFGEDVLLQDYFPENSGQYLDIGAGRPVKGSNTYKFYRRGWSGVTVDPIKLNSIMHRLFRSRDKFWLALCGSEEGAILELFEFFPYEYSTMKKDVAEKLIQNETARLVGQRYVICHPASKFISQLDRSLPTLICIDAEGSDFEILKSFDIEQLRPRVICLETIASSPESQEIKKYLEAMGYFLSAIAGHSQIYVDESFWRSSSPLVNPAHS